MSIRSAQQSLRENLRHLNQEEHKVLYNMNAALLDMAEVLERVERDVESLHNKIQPILNEMSNDASLTRRMTRDKR